MMCLCLCCCCAAAGCTAAHVLLQGANGGKSGCMASVSKPQHGEGEMALLHTDSAIQPADGSEVDAVVGHRTATADQSGTSIWKPCQATGSSHLQQPCQRSCLLCCCQRSCRPHQCYCRCQPAATASMPLGSCWQPLLRCNSLPAGCSRQHVGWRPVQQCCRDCMQQVAAAAAAVALPLPSRCLQLGVAPDAPHSQHCCCHRLLRPAANLPHGLPWVSLCCLQRHCLLQARTSARSWLPAAA